MARGLLKADWDESKHPRTGVPPNAGWFAPTQGEQEPAATEEPKAPRSGWPPPWVNALARKWATEAAEEMAAVGRRLIYAVPLVDAVLAFVKGMDLRPAGEGEDRLTAQILARLDPAKTLDELQTPPTENLLGYERHHIAEQNRNNLEKGDPQALPSLDKFGRKRIDDPSNLVWVSRFQHEKITSYYSREDASDPAKRLRRHVVNEMGFDAQREAGLAKLRELGILK